MEDRERKTHLVTNAARKSVLEIRHVTTYQRLELRQSHRFSESGSLLLTLLVVLVIAGGQHGESRAIR